MSENGQTGTPKSRIVLGFNQSMEAIIPVEIAAYDIVKVTLKICGLLLFAALLAYAQNRTETVYFPGEDYEITVYHISGREPGKTVMLLGGIQGDEPGGYLSADAYLDIRLRKGNIIVIPRANLPSILQNSRVVNGDMNRRFGDQQTVDYEDKVVSVIKKYMHQSDLFLNLHDGWGFYRPTYIDKNRNPRRFGQSIIIDSESYVFNGKTIELKKLAEEALRLTNANISDSLLHLHLMNTKTMDPNTPFPDMKLTGTYYAVTKCGIPAFGIESSKNIRSDDDKALYHIYAINAFLELFDVIPEHPFLPYYPAETCETFIKINDEVEEVYRPGDTLFCAKGDHIRITGYRANPHRGICFDISQSGSTNDLYRQITIQKEKEIHIRQDSHKLGKITIVPDRKSSAFLRYLFTLNGENIQLNEGETLNIKPNDTFKIVEVISELFDSGKVKVNLKGWVPSMANNPGEDRGYAIQGKELNWKKYSIDGEGKIYPIVTVLDDTEISIVYVAVDHALP
jgi:hypothetical protein